MNRKNVHTAEMTVLTFLTTTCFSLCAVSSVKVQGSIVSGLLGLPPNIALHVQGAEPEKLTLSEQKEMASDIFRYIQAQTRAWQSWFEQKARGREMRESTAFMHGSPIFIPNVGAAGTFSGGGVSNRSPW